MDKKGFTLVEILLALAIGSVVISILYATFHQSLAAMDLVEKKSQFVQKGRLLLERMTGELNSAFVPYLPTPSSPYRYGMIGESSKIEEDFRDRLDFTFFAERQAEESRGGSEIWEAGYFLGREPGGKGLTLFRRQDRAIDGDLQKGGYSEALCDGVRSLKFIFFDPEGNPLYEWNSLSGTFRNMLPSRVEIRLKLEDPEGRLQSFSSQVSLPLGLKK
jgi:general secretion pathway protein J